MDLEIAVLAKPDLIVSDHLVPISETRRIDGDVTKRFLGGHGWLLSI
jgi:hypothetical protein